MREVHRKLPARSCTDVRPEWIAVFVELPFAHRNHATPELPKHPLDIAQKLVARKWPLREVNEMRTVGFIMTCERRRCREPPHVTAQNLDNLDLSRQRAIIRIDVADRTREEPRRRRIARSVIRQCKVVVDRLWDSDDVQLVSAVL